MDLKKHNEALLMKMLYKFFNKQDLPWVQLIWDNRYKNGMLPPGGWKGSFRWIDILKTLPAFIEIAKIKTGNGSIVRLWQDKWSNTTILLRYLELFFYAINKDIIRRQAKMIPLIELYSIYHVCRSLLPNAITAQHASKYRINKHIR